MDFSSSDLTAIGLTLRLAAIVTVLLIVLATPLAWWLARTKSALKIPISCLGFFTEISAKLVDEKITTLIRTENINAKLFKS